VDPDLSLIHALQSGDDSALNELMSRHRESLFRFAYRVVRDETGARDVVQETFVRAYFNARKFKPRATVKTWLYSIALNLGRDHVRRVAKRRGDVPLDAAGTRPPHDKALITDSGADFFDEYTVLQRAIDGLPPKLREALILFSLEGKSQREAADILGTTPKTVELRVYHAKQKLRDLLKAAGEPEDLLRDRPPSERSTP
jgi:RNA polymerase sigma-70 factor (ECF subfamily)